MRAVAAFVKQLWCGLKGHKGGLLSYQPTRLSVRCVCGWESPGWEVGK